jgi:hypothetical protein
MMAAVQFAPGVFYECKGKTEFSKVDVVPNGGFDLKDGDLVRCSEIIHRRGGKGRGRYAVLHYTCGKKSLVLYHRVSKFNRGSGDWEELNEMMVVALADVLPLD